MIDVRVHAEFVADPVVVRYGESYQGPGTMKLRGYVCGYTDEERYGGPARGGWIELITRETLEEALRADSDIHLRWDYESLPLATRKSGTMTLTLDDTGLYVEASVAADEWNAQVKRVRDALGKIDGPLEDLDLQWGFSFRVMDQQWSTTQGIDDGHRRIDKIEFRDIGIIAVATQGTTAQVAAR